MDKDHIRILLIEDDEDDYALVRGLLSGLSLADFSLEWVKTYQEGLKELCRADHDVCLLDYRLGSRNGLELICEATGAGCDKPIIFLTGEENHGVDMEAIRSGAADYLVKACLTADTLDRSIRYSIARKKSERELKSCRHSLEDLVRERTEQLETANEKLRLEVAERKLAEEALQESEGELRGLFAAMTDVVLVLNADGHYVKIAPTSSMNLYRPPDELLGKKVHEILPKEDADKIFEQIKRALEKRQTINFEYALEIGSKEVWFDSKVSPLTDNTVFWIAHDITAHKQAEEALRESEKKYRELVENANSIIMRRDNVGNVTFFNEFAQSFFGYSEEEILGKNVVGTIVPQVESTTGRDLRLMIEDIAVNPDSYANNENENMRSSGERVWIAWTNKPVFDENGRISEILCIGNDITGRKRAEDKLRESETQLRQIIDLVPHMIFVKDWDGKYLLVNEAVAKADNMSVSALTGKYQADFHSNSSELQKMLQDDREVMMTGETKFIPEEPFTDARGNLRFHQATKVPFHIFGHKTPAVLGVAIDITKNKQAAESLRESEARLDLAIRSAHMGVWHIDLIENKRHFDDQVCHLLGIAPAKFTGTAEEFYKAVHPDDREMLAAALARSIEQDVLYEKEYRVVWPDGSVHYIITRGKLFRDETGQPVRMNGLVWDITEPKRAEEEREMLEAQLRISQKVEAIGTLAGGIAHDFNNILQPIIGYTEMELNELSPSNPVRKSLEQVLKASLRAKELIRQIMAISRSTQEQHRIPTDISSIIKEALTLLRSTLPTSIEMRQKIRKGVALADSTQIHQVLMNLCTNAAHAMNDKGILEVRLSTVDLSESDLAGQAIFDLKPGPYLKLTVSDTGCGMDAKTRERIFDPYFTTKEVGKGSGLGLAVIDGIVKRHEGAITVQSQPEKGTTFTIYIPSLDVRPETTVQVNDLPLRGSERILLVDDEPTLMEMGTSLLERLGYKVTSQTDSVKALEIFRSSPDKFDLVITDYTMPKLTGLDFAREVLRVRPDMPIMLCTGFSEKITPDSVKELGLGFLMKPYGMRQMSEAIRKILDA
jgi:PAS domain S-box-containing protein